MLKVCKRCGKDFNAKAHNAYYCSKACRLKERKCENCGVSFIPKTPNARFCSTSCGSISTHRVTFYSTECVGCGKLLQGKGTSKPLYCDLCRKKARVVSSTKHRKKVNTLRDVGIGSGKWQIVGDNATIRSAKGIHSREKIYRTLALERFNGETKCVVCGNTLRTLVHHIDHNPHNNVKENLTFVCYKCHTNHHVHNNPTTEDIIKYTDIAIC